MTSVRVLAVATPYRSHPLHGTGRTWSETNCYLDLWIEILHMLGLDPTPATVCALSADFEGDQWTFLKFAHEDLRALYGIEVAELNVWLPLVHHVADHMDLGRLLTVEVDAWYLPDTEGVSYRREHVKTTIVPNMLDVDHRRLGYFHNAGYFELGAEDFDGLLGIDTGRSAALVPYVEMVKLDRLNHGGHDHVLEVARKLAGAHLARRPRSNPMVRFRKRLDDDLPWLAGQNLDAFHRYAFGTCRQCGVSAELAATFVGWLDRHDGGGLGPVVGHFESISTAAKALEFALARVVRGRAVDLDGIFATLELHWDDAMAGLVARYGG